MGSTKRAFDTVFPPLLTLLLVGVVWEAGVRVLGIPAFLVPRPTAVLAAGWNERILLAGALLTTAARARCPASC